jgi:hypothetical protein
MRLVVIHMASLPYSTHSASYWGFMLEVASLQQAVTSVERSLHFFSF